MFALALRAPRTERGAVTMPQRRLSSKKMYYIIRQAIFNSILQYSILSQSGDSLNMTRLLHVNLNSSTRGWYSCQNMTTAPCSVCRAR